MKKAATILLLLLALGGCKEETKKEPGSTLRVLYAPDFFYFTEPGPRGLDIDLVRALSREMQVRPDFQAKPFQTILQDLRKKEGEVAVGGIVQIPERSSDVLFSDPYMKRNILRLQKDGPRVVAASSGGQPELRAEEWEDRGWRLRVTSTTREALRLLKDGQVSMVFAKEELVPSGGPWEIRERIPTGESYSLVVTSESLQKQINEALGQLRAEGTLQKIIRRWTPS